MSPSRALAPDLARGLMLWFIATANVAWYLYGARSGQLVASEHPPPTGLADQVVVTATILFVDLRTFPMFAFLLGYGMVLFHQNRMRRGLDETAARARLQRRHLVFVVLGFLHAALLWQGDILAGYGLAGLLLVALLFQRPDVVVARWAWGIVAIGLVVAAVLWVLAALTLAHPENAPEAVRGTPGLTEAMTISGVPDYLRSVPARLAFWLFIVFGQGLFGLTVPAAILLGWLAARTGVLADPGRHLPLLRRTAGLGLLIGVVGAMPNALGYLDLWPDDEVAWAPFFTALLTGLAGGLGYIALFALAAHHLSVRRRAADRPVGPVVAALAATGKRSLTCYLAQSVLLSPLMSAWGLGLGGRVTSTQASLLALLVWLATVLLAVALERAGRPGPAEALVHRLVDGPRRVPA